MAIIRLCRTYPRVSSPGIGLHCYHFSRLIDQKTVVFTKKMISPPLDLPSNVDFVEICYSDLSFRRQNESILRLSFIIVSKVWGEIVFSWMVLRYLRRCKVMVELIHLHSINFLLTALLLKWVFQAPVVMNFGGTDLVRLSRYKLFKWMVGRVDLALYVAKAMKPDLLKIFHKKQIRFIGNGVDLKQFKPTFKKRKRHFLAIGNLRWQKDYQTLLNAFRKVVDQEPGYCLSIAGEGEGRVELESQIAALDLCHHVSLRGVLGRDELVDLLNESYGFVMSSVSEGFPKVLIEAISCGTPVVVTDVGECREVAVGVGLVVPPRDVEALANAMLKMINDRPQWQIFAKQCLKNRQVYDWSTVISRVRCAYRELPR